MRQQNQTKINKDNICETMKRVDQDYKGRDKFMLSNSAAYKYKTQYIDPFVITQCCTNIKVTLQYDEIKIRYNTRRINPYTTDINVEDITPENMYYDVNIRSPVIYLCITY